jgi:hypothetical protein
VSCHKSENRLCLSQLLVALSIFREKIMTCLLESSSVRKTKISLADYDYQKDIQNRILMSQFTHSDLAVLEAILYSSLQIPITNLAKELEMNVSDLLPILEKIEPSGLFVIEKQSISVDKERRKYFESQIQKFEDDFLPDMEFLQDLLKKVPIHVLPVWYAISRTSNNIFDSLVEKHLSSPQVFQRYLADLNLDPILKQIVDDVFSSEELEVPSDAIIKKYSLTREMFEEYMLHLEFHFICCQHYRKEKNGWKELVAPFREWKEYLGFLKTTDISPIADTQGIDCPYTEEGSFFRDVIAILQMAQKQNISLTINKHGLPTFSSSHLTALLKKISYRYADSRESYLQDLIMKLSSLHFVDLSQKKLQVEEIAEKWLALSEEEQALYLYRNPKNRIPVSQAQKEICCERTIREVEKSLSRVVHKGWIFFDEFMSGVHVPLQECQVVTLKKKGRSWSYVLPSYTQEEKDFFDEVITHWLADAGFIQTGFLCEKKCFRVTNLGQKIFAR